MNKQQLASKIWASANRMRSKIEANEYKDYILGFIFYKYISDKEEIFLRKNDWTDEDMPELKEDDEVAVKFCQDDLGYFISYDNLFSTWLKKGRDFNVADVREALSAFSRLISNTHKKVFEDIFETLQTGLSKLGESSGAQTKAINDLIQLIKDIPTGEGQDYDVLGFIYEYLISNFAANAGKKAGEFYTPHEVSLLMSEIVADHLRDRDKIEIYDPTSGSGSLLINIGRSIGKYIDDKNNIKYYAQELKANTYNLTRMNLVMRNILPDNIVTRNADTLEDDWPHFDESDKENTYTRLRVDAVVSNPPYSQTWEPTHKEMDPRYREYGIAPRGKADYAFLLHDLYHVRNDGIMTIVLPHGVLFRGGEEEVIRTNLIEKNKIDAIIGLPSNIFFGTGIPTIIMVLKHKRDDDDIMIIDASKGFIKEGKNNKLRASDIKKIADAYINRLDIPKYSRKVSRQEFRDNEYNLNIPRYVDSSTDAEVWDLYASMFGGIPNSEIDSLVKYWDAFPTLRREIFDTNDTPYSTLSSGDIEQVISNNDDVRRFIANFNNEFSSFPSFLKEELINKMLTIKISQEENVISDKIFTALADLPLIDEYVAYQLFNDEWVDTQTDLEMIQTEGFETTKRVDPNMVTKKVKGKDEEVQDGWVGRVIPFELVQQTKLSEKVEKLSNSEIALQKHISEREELLEKLVELGEGEELLNDDNSAFVTKDLNKKIRELSKNQLDYKEDTLEYIVLRVGTLLDDERKLKRDIKKQTDDLHALTKQTIENLSDSEALELLEQKWITPLCESLSSMPINIINTLVSKTTALSEKYAVTFSDLSNEIKDAETSLSSMIDDLVGDDYDMKGLKELKSLLGGERNE